MIEEGRLRRALSLEAERTGPSAWTVTGGASSHRVVRSGDRLQCDCLDAAYRQTACKHRLRVGLAIGNPRIVRALRALVKP